jgi:2-C-methyl-D-erythritol 2,4-cyclodiphosphate synthase
VTVVAQEVRVAPHRDAIRSGLADVMSIQIGNVSVKATTTDGLGFIGKGEGVAAIAIVTVEALS